MTEKATIAVIGATGAQGGGLVRAILDAPESGFAARAITRDPDSEKARALADRGVEVVQADTDDEASLRRAFDGAHGVYCVTNYWENMIYFGMGPKPGPDGTLAISMPMGDRKLPGLAVGDIGACAFGVFRRGAELAGRYVGVAGEHHTGAEMAEALTRALGRKVVYRDVPPDVYRGLGFPGAVELGNMFQFYRDFADDICAARPIAVCREIHPGLQTLAQWLEVHKNRIPLE